MIPHLFLSLASKRALSDPNSQPCKQWVFPSSTRKGCMRAEVKGARETWGSFLLSEYPYSMSRKKENQKKSHPPTCTLYSLTHIYYVPWKPRSKHTIIVWEHPETIKFKHLILYDAQEGKFLLKVTKLNSRERARTQVFSPTGWNSLNFIS